MPKTSLRSPEKLNRMDWRGILKAQTRQYKRFVGDRYHPATATEPDRFDLIADTSFTLTGLKPGRYNVEFWETWGSDEVSTTQLDVTDSGELVIGPAPVATRPCPAHQPYGPVVGPVGVSRQVDP